MERRIRTRLDLLHPTLSARMAEKTENAAQSTLLVFEIGEPVMAKDYQAQQSKWTRGVIQDHIGPVTYQVQVGDLFWKRHLDQLRSIAGCKVADQGSTDQIDPEHLDPLPSLIPQQSRQEPKVLSCDPVSTTLDTSSPVPDFPSPAPMETCKSHFEEKASPC